MLELYSASPVYFCLPVSGRFPGRGSGTTNNGGVELPERFSDYTFFIPF
jgi:hypothetical protein